MSHPCLAHRLPSITLLSIRGCTAAIVGVSGLNGAITADCVTINVHSSLTFLHLCNRLPRQNTK
jgi:hypothetical protein